MKKEDVKFRKKYNITSPIDPDDIPGDITDVFKVRRNGAPLMCFEGDNGKCYYFSEYSEFLGLSRYGLIQRFYKYGMKKKLLVKRGGLVKTHGNEAWQELMKRDVERTEEMQLKKLKSIGYGSGSWESNRKITPEVQDESYTATNVLRDCYGVQA